MTPPAVKFHPIVWRASKARPCHRCKRRLRPGTPEGREGRRIVFGPGVTEFVLCGTCIPMLVNELAAEFERWAAPPPPPAGPTVEVTIVSLDDGKTKLTFRGKTLRV